MLAVVSYVASNGVLKHSSCLRKIKHTSVLKPVLKPVLVLKFNDFEICN